MASKRARVCPQTREPPFSPDLEAEMRMCAEQMRACDAMQERLQALTLLHLEKGTQVDRRFAAMYSDAMKHLDNAGQCLLTISLQ